MQIFDTIIRNGLIVDGTGAAAFYGDVGVLNGKVAAVGNLRSEQARVMIDAAGKIIAPGHVTQHSHYDAAIFWDPYLSNSGENGVTTVTNANCGFGFAPVRPADRERTMAMMETTEQIPVRHQRAAMPWDWETFPDYLATLRRIPKGVNIMTYLPLNPLLIYVMGVEAAKSRAPTSDEMKVIHRLINEGMDAGAIGISMSVMGAEGNSHVDFDGTPMPTDSMSPKVAVEIARAVADRGEGVIQLLSQIAFYGDRSVTEKIAVMAKGSGARVIHNIFLTSDVMPDMVKNDLAWLDDLRARGLDVTSGTLLYRGWIETTVRDLDTAAGQLFSVRKIINCRDDAEIMELVTDSNYRAEFVREYAETGPSNGAGGFEQQVVIDVGATPSLKPYLGRTLGDIAAELGQNVVEVLLDLASKSSLALQLKSAPIAARAPQQALELMRHAGVAVGVSDGGAHTKAFAFGHYGTDLLIWLVRDEKLMTLEEAHFQLSLKAAQTLQLRDRGAIVPGFWADLIVYDLDALHIDLERMEIVHDMPEGDWRRRVKAGGYQLVMVNGVVTHEQGVTTGETPGRLVRVTRDRAMDLPVAAE